MFHFIESSNWSHFIGYHAFIHEVSYYIKGHDFQTTYQLPQSKKKPSIEGTKSKETLASLALGGYVHGVVAHAPRISWQRSTKGLPVLQKKGGEAADFHGDTDHCWPSKIQFI